MKGAQNTIASQDRILLFIPMYNCAAQIPRVLAQLSEDIQSLLAEVIIVDNRSTDHGHEAVKSALAGDWAVPVRLLRNDQNYGLGGSHKVAFNYAIAKNFDYCIVLHGDDQGSIADLLPHIRSGAHKEVDCLLGARFMKGARLEGYSAFRTLGNRIFNLVYSIAAFYTINDLGSGLNMYAVKPLKGRRYLNHANNLTFNYFMVLDSINSRWKIRFFPIAWREDDQISNVKLFRQAFAVLKIALGYGLFRGRFLNRDHAGGLQKAYSATLAYENRPMVARE